MRWRGLVFALGFLAGLAAGTGYAWLVRPVRFANAVPASLRADFRDEYLALIAAAFQAGGDGQRAHARLALFPDLQATDLADLGARLTLLRGGDAAVHGLATLAVLETFPLTPTPALSVTATRMANLTPLATFPLTVLPFPTAAPLATMPPAATPLGSVRLLNREEICDPLVGLRLEVYVRTKNGTPAAGVEVRIRWAGGVDHFFTGFKPSVDPGYGDFRMDSDTEYQIEVTGLAMPVGGIRAPSCSRGDGSVYYGGVRLRFEGE